MYLCVSSFDHHCPLSCDFYCQVVIEQNRGQQIMCYQYFQHFDYMSCYFTLKCYFSKKIHDELACIHRGKSLKGTG